VWALLQSDTSPQLTTVTLHGIGGEEGRGDRRRERGGGGGRGRGGAGGEEDHHVKKNIMEHVL